MSYKGNFTSVYEIPGDVYAIDYIPEIRAIAAVNISSSDAPSKVSLVNADTGVYPMHVCLSVCRCLSVCLSVASVCFSVCLSFCLYVYSLGHVISLTKQNV